MGSYLWLWHWAHSMLRPRKTLPWFSHDRPRIHPVFLYDQAAFIGGTIGHTVEAGGDFLVYRCIGYEIAGDLFGGEFFKDLLV